FIPTFKPGDWNHMRIRVRGQAYEVWVNHLLVNTFEGDRSAHGFIGLQNHDDHSPVRFRNIRITR
ncbi:MAG: DUF1080 domain-containing protein, partial [Planctomycetota bacterium]